MMLRLSGSLSRAILALASVFLAAWLCFFAARTGLAGLAAEGADEKRLQWAVRLEPKNSDYWFRLGHYQQFNLEQPDVIAAVASYQKAVEINPGNTDAWLDLGTAYELNGDAAAAGHAYERAKKSYPASAEVAWRYGNFLLRHGMTDDAFRELNVSLRADPRRAGAVFSRAYRAEPDIDKILAELLPADAGAYIDAIREATASRQLAVARTIWMRLIQMHPRLSLLDFDQLSYSLLESGDAEAAKEVWDQGTATMDIPPLIQPQGSVLWDPSFESGIVGRTFSWSFQPLVQGVSAEFDAAEKLSGRQSLRMTFDGKHNPNLDLACATGVVTPGMRYLFSGWLKTRDITGDEGIRFRILSLGDTRVPMVTTRDVHGTTPWTFIDQQWTAAPNIRRVQVCIRREASANPDIHISGSAWADDVTLVPQPVEKRRR